MYSVFHFEAFGNVFRGNITPVLVLLLHMTCWRLADYHFLCYNDICASLFQLGGPVLSNICDRKICISNSCLT